ncbi:MAG: hypothetical protein K6G10_09570 [Butyrivibrio sp.]|nr:hypothetical protein [Butyrivibrio sp.]
MKGSTSSEYIKADEGKIEDLSEIYKQMNEFLVDVESLGDYKAKIAQTIATDKWQGINKDYFVTASEYLSTYEDGVRACYDKLKEDIQLLIDNVDGFTAVSPSTQSLGE